MKCVELRERHAIDGLVLAQRPEPRPEKGEVLVRIRAASLNYRDLLIVKGERQWKRPLPLIPLSDAAGEVVELGPGVSRVRVGDRVAGIFVPGWLDGDLTAEKDGPALGEMLVEYRALRADDVVRVPEHLSYTESATLPCAAVTAWNALTGPGAVKPGDTVLVLGTGGVSLFAFQFATMMGARVVCVSRSETKLARARGLGAWHTLSSATTPDWPEALEELTAGKGVDHVVDVVGELSKSVRAIRLGGSISVIGMLSGFSTEVDPAAIMGKNARIRGLQVGSREMFEAMNRALAQHQLRPVVDVVFPIEDARAAFERLEAGSHFGKVCVSL